MWKYEVCRMYIGERAPWRKCVCKPVISFTAFDPCALRDVWGSFKAGEAEALSDSEAKPGKQGRFEKFIGFGWFWSFFFCGLPAKTDLFEWIGTRRVAHAQHMRILVSTGKKKKGGDGKKVQVPMHHLVVVWPFLGLFAISAFLVFVPNFAYAAFLLNRAAFWTIWTQSGKTSLLDCKCNRATKYQKDY